MKIEVVGSNCTWTEGLSTSFIIDDEIMFDAPQGSFKTLMHKYDLGKIKYIIISHFHSDHFADLHLVLNYIYKNFPQNKLTVLAPSGCKERLFNLFRILEVAYLEEYTKERVSFLTIENGKKFKFGNHNFKCFKMLHGNLDSYGFTIENNGVKVGFTGDTAMCNSVIKILKKVSHCFIDTSNIVPDNKHLSVNEVLSLDKQFPECKLHLVHLSSYSKEELEELKFPYTSQGETVYID